MLSRLEQMLALGGYLEEVCHSCSLKLDTTVTVLRGL